MKSSFALPCLVLAALVVGPALAAEPAKAAFKPDPAKGLATVTAVCGACHTADGSRGSPANPILQGQHPEYLVKQLQEFKSGKRNNPVMKAFATTLGDDDMKHVAAFYAGKTARPGAAKSKQTIRLGERIWRGGIGDKAVAACAGCHGPTGAGNPSQYPRLGGQHGDYVEAQLLAFRAGARGNSVQMSAVVAKMNDLEIKAVSDYIAGLR